MKKIIGLLVVLIMLISATAGLAGGTAATDTQPENTKEYKKTLNIVASEPVSETYLGHDVLGISGYNFMIETSVPMLPMKTVSLVIPQSAEIISIKVLSSTKEKMRGDYDILPVQEPVPISRNTPVAFTPKNPSIYASSNPYPGKLIEYAGEGNLRDYRILSINVYPMQYNAAGKKLTYYSNIEIEVTYTAPPDNTEKTEKTEDDEFSKIVKAMVYNPEDVDTLSITTTESTSSEILENKNVDYVIITSAAFEEEFQTLVDHKISKGLSAEVVTLSWITGNYTGADTQEQIRNFIIDAEVTWNTKWILLGGDTDIIPHRLAYCKREYIPTDLYFSDLDGTWNDDGDSRYGEIEDYIDLYSDVFVGRAPVNTNTEADIFVSKTIAYEQGPSGYETTALFIAEYLDVNTDGGITKDMIHGESIPDTFTVTKLYESLGNLNYNNVMDEMNEGYGIINHIGHANYNVLGIGPSALYNTNMDSLTNSPKNSIFYSIGCWSNALDRDSIAEHFVLNQNGGGIAYIGNSRYGWYSPGSPGYGTSEKYDREFFKLLFTEDFDNIGETLADSKATYVPSSQYDGTYRYIQYSLNLLGDPETQIWTANILTPPELSVIVTSPTIANIDENFTIEAIISNLGTETANGVNATISLPEGLSLATGEFQTKPIDDIINGDSATVLWTINAGSEGTYNITVEASATNAATASGSAYAEVITSDTTPPIVTLTAPLDDANITTESYTVNATASDGESGVALVEFKYSLDEGLNWFSIGTDTISPFEVMWDLGAIADQTGIQVKAIATNNAELAAEDINSGIVHDATAPIATVSINGGTEYTTTRNVALNLTYSDATSGIADCRYSNDASSWSEWETCTESKAWTLTEGDGAKTVYYEARDNAENVEQVTDTIVLDTTLPTGSVAINDGASYTNSSVVTLTMSAADSNGVAEMMASNDEAFSDAVFESYATSKVWTLTAGDETKTVYVKYRDNAGLESTIYSEYIILDTTPPAHVEGVRVTTISSSELNISWTENTEVDLHHYNVYRSTTKDGPYELVASPTTNSCLDTGLAASTAYYYKINAMDDAGNKGILSVEAFGTTKEAGNVMHIDSIEMSTERIKSNGWYTYATAKVHVVDGYGTSVAGATVSGDWSELTSDVDLGPTDLSGKIALDSDLVKNAAGTFTFTVIGVTYGDLKWDGENSTKSIIVYK